MNAKPFELLRLFLIALLLTGAPLTAAENEDDEEEFTPRTGTPPAKRTGGASRHLGGADLPRVSILAPAETLGLTGRERPVIYWHLSEATDLPIEIGINKQDRSTVLELTLEGKKKAGLHALDLRKLEFEGEPVKLDPGVGHEVAIAVVADEREASKNSTATARLMRVEPDALPEAAKTRDEGEDPAKVASVYAKEGLWFDYLDALNRALEARPKDEALLKKRTKLLIAEGLELKPDGTLVEASKKRDPDAAE